MMANERSARLIRKGDVVRVQVVPDTDPVEEVVRGVSIILHLANGGDVRLDTTDRVEVLPPEELPDVNEVQEVVRADKQLAKGE